MLLISDIDGTLVEFDETPSLGIVSAFKEWYGQGGRVSLTSARTALGVWEIAQKLELPRMLCSASNGAVLAEVTPETFRILDVNKIPDAEIRHYLNRNDLSTLRFETYDSVRYRVMEKIGYELWGKSRQVSIDELFKLPLVAVYECIGDKPNHNLHSFEKDGVWWIQHHRQGVNKGSSVPLLVSATTSSSRGVLATGDQMNDIPLFERVGASYVMGNAPDTLKTWAQQRNLPMLKTVAEGGVTHLITEIMKG